MFGLGYDVRTVGERNVDRQVGELAQGHAFLVRAHVQPEPADDGQHWNVRAHRVQPPWAITSPTGGLWRSRMQGLRPYAASNPIWLSPPAREGAVGSANGAMSWQNVLNATPSAR